MYFHTTIVIQVVSWHHFSLCIVVKCLSLLGLFDAFAIRPYGTYFLRISLDKVDLIKDRLLMAQSRQKSYANRNVHDLEFTVGSEFHQKFHRWRIWWNFNRRKSWAWVYNLGGLRLALPPSLFCVHPIFLIPILKKYHQNNFHLTRIDLLSLDHNLIFKKELVTNLDRHIQKLRSKEVDSVKVQSKG